MKCFLKILSFGLGIGLLSACSPKENQTPSAPPARTNRPAAKAPSKAESTNEVGVIKTNYGEMVISFWPEVAPKTVENFKNLARSGFYNGTAFHRIIDGFMIQGGDPITKDPNREAEYGTGGPTNALGQHITIPAEFNDRKHERGVISMARSSDPNSAGSQFFICLAPAPNLDHQYTAFGKLIKGDDVLGKIGKVPVQDNGRGEMSKPVSRVHLESIRIVPADSIK